MELSKYAQYVVNNWKMFNIFFEAYIAAQLIECCEGSSDRWMVDGEYISAQTHRQLVDWSTNIRSDRWVDASDAYEYCYDIMEKVLEDTDYESSGEYDWTDEGLWGELAFHCWEIANDKNWWLDNYDEFIKEYEYNEFTEEWERV